jgi:hypothetical protein
MVPAFQRVLVTACFHQFFKRVYRDEASSGVSLWKLIIQDCHCSILLQNLAEQGKIRHSSVHVADLQQSYPRLGPPVAQRRVRRRVAFAELSQGLRDHASP